MFFGELNRRITGKAPKHFICTYMVKAERFRLSMKLPIGPCGFQHVESPVHIGLYKVCWAINGSVHVGFSRQMHHCIRLVFFKNRVESSTISDICMFKEVLRALTAVDIRQVSCIGQRIEILTTLCPRAIAKRTTAEPINPAPPVTKIFIEFSP